MANPRELICPVCGANVPGLICPDCDQDLGPLRLLSSESLSGYGTAWALAKDGQIDAARSQMEVVISQQRQPEYTGLYGWLLFLAGECDKAYVEWGEIPALAALLTRSYNTALVQAKCGEHRDALTSLQLLDFPFLPALLLRFACSQAVGDADAICEGRRVIQRAFPSYRGRLGHQNQVVAEPLSRRQLLRRPAVLVAAASGLLLIGATVGAGVTLMMPGATAPSGATEPSQAIGVAPLIVVERAQPEGLVLDPTVVAYLTGSADSLAPRMTIAALGGGADSLVLGIPPGVRAAQGRRWYLTALQANGRSESQTLVRLLPSAIGSVGAASKVYWIDDALYLLMGALDARGDPQATHVASLLQTYHPGSMYNNSITRRIVGGR